MKNHHLIPLLLFSFAIQSFGQKANWTVNPFNHKIFVENNGQFDADINTSDKVLYQANLGDVKMYFTSQGVIYKYDEHIKSTGSADVDRDKEILKPVTHYLSATWVGANPQANIETGEEQTYYYTYPSGSNGTVKARVFETITYRNIYPGIDIVYFFPEGKSGIEYNVIVHPGADASAVKLKYMGAGQSAKNESGDAIIKSGIGIITDHAPDSYQVHWDGTLYGYHRVHFKSEYRLEGNVESFSIDKGLDYDKSNDLIIDPWTTNPNFSAQNKGYDIDYDNTGNVYVYGSINPFQLAKFNSAGVEQWMFNATSLVVDCYGGFAVDKNTGTSYLTEGYDANGAKALKVNTSGTLKAIYTGNTNLDEMWRIKYIAGTGKLVVGAGGTSTNNQAGILDTNLGTLTTLNMMGVTTAYHDICLFALDPDGSNCYMCAASDAIDTGNGNNFLYKLPITTLSPPAFSVRDGFHFNEDGTVGYIGKGAGYGYANGYNGIAVSREWLYLSDGASLERLDKNSGAILQKTKISNRVANGSGFYNLFSGGLDVDSCGNIYIGYDSAIEVYNSSLSPLSSIILPDTVYAISVNKGTLYACGTGFVSSIAIKDSCDIFTAIPSTIKNNTSVKVYPNPGDGLFIFQLMGVNGKSNIEIYNMLGQQVYYNQLNICQNDDFKIDLSNQSKGIYLYRITSEKGANLNNGKLIIK